jgi:hypothetical protein
VLLPLPPGGFEHLVLLGGSEAVAETIVEEGVAGRVSRVVPAERSADAAAILDGAGVGCEEVARSLRPGASLYWEVRTRGRLTTSERRLRARLHRAGFSLTGLYWARPDFQQCHQFIPLDFPEALEWYLSMSANRSLWRRLLTGGPGLRWAAMAALRIARHRVVIATLGSGNEVSPSILEHPSVRREIGEVRARCLVINRAGTDASRRIAVFPFAPGAKEPATVLKFSRLPERNEDLEEEQRIAGEIRERLDFRMRQTIPAPLGTFRWGAVVVGVECFARGMLLSSHPASQRRTRIEDLRLVTLWFKDFHSQTRLRDEPLTPLSVRTRIEGPLAAYVSAFGATPYETRLFEQTRERALSLQGKVLPIVWSHTGFSEGNISRSHEEINVFDWEATEAGIPLRDLIYFVTGWHYRSSGCSGSDARLRSFEKLFLFHHEDVLAQHARTALADGMNALSIDVGFFPVLLVMTWVMRALGRLKRIHAFSGPPGDARENILDIAFLQILAANVEGLFGEGIR